MYNYKGKSNCCSTVCLAYLLIEPSAAVADDGCFPSDVSIAARQRTKNPEPSHRRSQKAANTKKKHPNKNKRKRKGGSTLWDVRGSGCGGATLRDVHGGEAAALGPVLLVPVLRHGCAARPPGPGPGA
jgi:hypothetical protein